MHLRGSSALVTGAGSGIGAHLACELAKAGCSVTVADCDTQGAKRTVEQIQQSGGQAQWRPCDVTNDEEQAAAFEAHIQAYGRLDFAILNAGIGERGNFVTSSSSGWQATLDVDLRAVMVGTRLAARAMVAQGAPGVILAVASAGGLFPMPVAPVYAAAKAGVVHFVRSAAPALNRKHIRLAALCPQFVDTPLVQQMLSGSREAADRMLSETRGQILTTGQVVGAALGLLTDNSKVGTVAVVLTTGQLLEWQQPKKNMVPLTFAEPAGDSRAPSTTRQQQLPAGPLPRSLTKLQVHRLSSNFREATAAVQAPLPSQPPPGQVVVRLLHAGINASDVNYTAGRYFGSTADAQRRLPFDAGFEAVGVVAAAASDVADLRVGDAVAAMSYGCFADYLVLPARLALPVPEARREVVALLTSGLTASIGLEVAGRMTSGQTVLVTAAAGGTGQFVVQLAKLAGNHVVATCGGDDKARLLRQLGADRVINYRQEIVKEVLKKEYPKGIDLVWESVGGEMFETCINALAQNGRLVVLGMMSQYGSGWPVSQHNNLPEKLLWKSATISGFFLLHYARHYRRHLARLAQLQAQGKLHVALDPRPFSGLAQVADAVDHLQSGASLGKVVVDLAPQQEQGSAMVPARL